MARNVTRRAFIVGGIGAAASLSGGLLSRCGRGSERSGPNQSFPATHRPANPFSAGSRGGTSGNPALEDFEIARLNELGVAMRRCVYNTSTTPGAGFNLPVQKYIDAGFRIQPQIKHTQPLAGGGHADTLPADVEAFKDQVRRCIGLSGALIVNAGEEVTLAHNWQGSVRDYERFLVAVLDVCRDEGIPCLNDGMFTGHLVHGVYWWLKNNDSLAAADRFWSRAAESWLRKGENEEAWATKTKPYWDLYRRAAPDYVNVHQYWNDAGAVRTAIQVVQEYTGRPVAINEGGYVTDAPPDPEGDYAGTLKLMEVYSELPIFHWYSNDSMRDGRLVPGHRSLWNPDGTLRETGEAVRDFIAANYVYGP
jgi:hypothetical protein